MARMRSFDMGTRLELIVQTVIPAKRCVSIALGRDPMRRLHPGSRHSLRSAGMTIFIRSTETCPSEIPIAAHSEIPHRSPMPVPEEPVAVKHVCVIGDSHTAALKAGWTSIAGEFPGADLTFFAARRELLVNLAVQDGALVPTDPRLRRAFDLRTGGATRIEPRFGGYILCGMGSGAKTILPLLSQHRPATIAPDGRQGLSNACYATCMARLLALTPMMWLLGLLRQISDAARFRDACAARRRRSARLSLHPRLRESGGTFGRALPRAAARDAAQERAQHRSCLFPRRRTSRRRRGRPEPRQRRIRRDRAATGAADVLKRVRRARGPPRKTPQCIGNTLPLPGVPWPGHTLDSSFWKLSQLCSDVEGGAPK